ncbi:MAG: UDP-3-O-(3-hydroxymyristoyl)glucosamine N-acyltransferase [Saprospiraceae bacterium]|nr:UDP-3-O-(3-hydroxymyristoyl)glucosamine N-acyltransferase [Saprospiraceae bacterium]
MQKSASQIAMLLEGKVFGNPDVIISGPSKIEEGKPGTISFLGNPKYAHYIYDTLASAVLVSKDFVPERPLKATLISVENVYASLAILMEHFSPKIANEKIISSTSIIDPTVHIGDEVSIDDYVIIKANVRIGSRSKIFAQVYIGNNVHIGDNVLIYPGVKIYRDCVIGNNCVIHANAVIGSDGFGFGKDDSGGYKKIAQLGNVVIEDDVEIGSNTVIDRASIGSTMIKKGVKLDNLIQVGHNVTIGENTVIAAQTGIAGSTKIGPNCLIGGQVGFKGHIDIAEGTMIQAQSGIGSNIKHENTKWYGSPAIDFNNYLKSYAYFRKFPEIVQQMRKQEIELDRLKQEIKNFADKTKKEIR